MLAPRVQVAQYMYVLYIVNMWLIKYIKIVFLILIKYFILFTYIF